jgi:hypothetical protein
MRCGAADSIRSRADSGRGLRTGSPDARRRRRRLSGLELHALRLIARAEPNRRRTNSLQHGCFCLGRIKRQPRVEFRPSNPEGSRGFESTPLRQAVRFYRGATPADYFFPSARIRLSQPQFAGAKWDQAELWSGFGPREVAASRLLCRCRPLRLAEPDRRKLKRSAQ